MKSPKSSLNEPPSKPNHDFGGVQPEPLHFLLLWRGCPRMAGNLRKTPSNPGFQPPPSCHPQTLDIFPKKTHSKIDGFICWFGFFHIDVSGQMESYFTNLDFPEIAGDETLPKRYLLGEIGCVRSRANLTTCLDFPGRTRQTMVSNHDVWKELKSRSHQLSHEKNPPTFHYTGWFIGILVMVY